MVLKFSIRKNVIRRKKMYFERTLIEKTTLAHQDQSQT